VVHFISPISKLDRAYLDLNNLFKDNAGELYSFKIDSERESGVIIRDTVGRSLPIDWYDIPEFAKAFNYLNEVSLLITQNNFNY